MGLSGEPDMRSSDARILYAEDDADTRVLVSYLLSRAGYEVVVAANPEQLARLAQIGSFDLYLLDNWILAHLASSCVAGSGSLIKTHPSFSTRAPLMNRISVLH